MSLKVTNARRKQRVRNSLRRSAGGRPRLSVFRSSKHIYAQVIDDTTGQTLAAASSLDTALRDFKPVKKEAPATQSKAAEQEEALAVEMATEAASTRGKGAKVEKSPAKNTQSQKGSQGKGGKPAAQSKTVLPTAQKGEKKTPVEALAAISDNRKVALAREVGKLVGQRAKEKGVSRVVFDRGGYAYHGRVAARADGALPVAVIQLLQRLELINTMKTRREFLRIGDHRSQRRSEGRVDGALRHRPASDVCRRASASFRHSARARIILGPGARRASARRDHLAVARRGALSHPPSCGI